MEKKKGGKLKWIIIVIVALGIIAAATGNKEKEDNGPKKVGTTNEDKADKGKDKTATESNDAEETTESNEFVVGDIVETDELKITFISAGEYKAKESYFTPKDGCIYYKVEFEMENISEKDQYVSSMAGWECYADGYSCDQTFILDDDISATLSAGKKVKGSVCFEVPKDAKELTVEYKDSFLEDEKVIFRCK